VVVESAMFVVRDDEESLVPRGARAK